MVRLTLAIQAGDAETARLVRGSRIAALVALVGFIVVGSMIASNAQRLHALQAQVDERRQTMIDLEQSIEDLNNEIYTLRYSPTDRIVARASEQAIPDIFERGRQVYDFTIWIDLSSYRNKAFSRVTYRTSGDAAPFEERVAENAINGFSISYRGTQCVREMSLQVVFEDGNEEIVPFDMCSDLGR